MGFEWVRCGKNGFSQVGFGWVKIQWVPIGWVRLGWAKTGFQWVRSSKNGLNGFFPDCGLIGPLILVVLKRFDGRTKENVFLGRFRRL